MIPFPVDPIRRIAALITDFLQMDRKGIISITLVVVAYAIWTVHYSKEMAKYQEAKHIADSIAIEKAKVEAPLPAVAPVDGAPQVSSTTVPALPTEPLPPEKIEKISAPLVEYSFTNLGGGISKAVLLKHLGELANQDGTGEATNVTLNEFGEIPIGAITERANETPRLPYNATVNADLGEITYERTDARNLQIIKKFTVFKESNIKSEYLVGLDVTFSNHSDQSITLPSYFVHAGSAGPIHHLDQAMYIGADWYHGDSNTFRPVSSFSSGGTLGMGKRDEPVFQQNFTGLDWMGVTNQYFCTIVTPANAKGSSIFAEHFLLKEVEDVAPAMSRAKQGCVKGALGMDGFTLAPGQSVSQRFDVFAGPREYKRLKLLGHDQEAIMDFGTFRVVSKFLLVSMNWLYAILGSYAAAIIVLTLIIRTLMWPLQSRSTETMKKMQVLTPEINKLKEKYKDDPQRMNQEMIKMYRGYGMSPVPIAGCLPMLVQIPIFFGLFRMLGKAVELRNSHFLWVQDLSQPDTIAHIMGYPLNILPLLMAATMLVQMQLTPKSGDAMQQRMFMFMPLTFVFFCYNYASGLALYWTVQNIFTIGQLYISRNKATPVLQKIAAPSKKKRG